MKRALLLICSVVLTVMVIAPTLYSQALNPLFRFKGSPYTTDNVMRSSIASVREAEIELLYSGTEADAFMAHKFYIPLFDGKQYEVFRTDLEVRKANDLVWRGKLKDRIESDVILTYKDGFISGLIQTADRSYEIIPRGNKHILVELQDDLFPECGGSPAPEKGSLFRSYDASPSPESTSDSGDRLDVLVIYTTATKNFLGGEAQAAVFAQSAIDSTNTTYINSGIRQRLRLVHSAEYLFTETGNSSNDLSTLRLNSAVQTLRNTHNADLVAMIGEVSDVCGIAYLIGGATQQAHAYSITARSCAVGNLTFAHELGHNMGSNHNPENSGSGAFAPYSYGHWVNGVFRTVMSYTNPCTMGCVRRPYFSGPGVFTTGIATGIANQRDNIRSINETAVNVSNYRYSGNSITLTNFKTSGILHRNVSRQINWTSTGVTGNVRIQVSRDEGRSWQTVLDNVTNNGSASIVVQGKNTKRGRVRVASVANPHITDSSTKDIFIK